MGHPFREPHNVSILTRFVLHIYLQRENNGDNYYTADELLRYITCSPAALRAVLASLRELGYIHKYGDVYDLRHQDLLQWWYRIPSRDRLPLALVSERYLPSAEHLAKIKAADDAAEAASQERLKVFFPDIYGDDAL